MSRLHACEVEKIYVALPLFLDGAKKILILSGSSSPLKTLFYIFVVSCAFINTTNDKKRLEQQSCLVVEQLSETTMTEAQINKNEHTN